MNKKIKAMLSVAAFTVCMFAMTIMVSAATATVNVPTKYFGNEKELTQSYSYNNNTKLDVSDSECGLVIPVKISTPGTLKVKLNYTRLDKSLEADLYTDSACTNRVSGFFVYGTQGDVMKEDYVSLTKAGTYYLKVNSTYFSWSTEAFTNSFNLTVSEYTMSDKTIKSGQTINYYRQTSDKYWFKYKAAKTGSLTVKLNATYGSYITLNNSKKKAISDEEWVSSGYHNNQWTFAVKKGTTYYISVSSISDNEINGITVKNTAIKEKSGSSRKKAVTLKAKKTVKGTVLYGSKTSDWYKIKVNKKKKVTFTLNGNVSGGIKFIVYNSKGKKIDTYNYIGNKALLSLTYGTSYGKANAGTYYIRMVRKDKKSSGTYSLKWK